MTGSWTVRGIVVLAVFTGAAVLWMGGAPASGAGEAQPAATAAWSSLTALGGEEAAYIGSSKCKMCHLPTYKSWEGTPHAKALETLKPGQAAEAKTKGKLDPEKDYSTDESCLACHVVGLGKPGGYAVSADAKEAEKMAKNLGHVGCESCHGAGGSYEELHKEIQKSKRTYTAEEMQKAGTLVADENTCKTCHNEKSPTFDASKPFNFEEMKKEGVHEKPELKQKQG